MDFLNLPNKARCFLFFMIGAPFIGLFVWVFLNAFLDKRKASEIFLDSRRTISCEGKVQEIYRQKMNHNVQTLKAKNCIFQIDAKWEDRFEIGDSISKKEGELFVEHYRDGKLLEILDYHDIARRMK